MIESPNMPKILKPKQNKPASSEISKMLQEGTPVVIQERDNLVAIMPDGTKKIIGKVK